MKIGRQVIGEDRPFFLIEEGQANLGDFAKAKRMIEVAAQCGADGIEFQLARAADFYVKSDPGYEKYLKREFDEVQLKELVEYSKLQRLEFVVAPLSAKLVEILTGLNISAFTVNSSDLNNPEIIDAIAQSGIPFTFSLPLATEAEIDWAVKRISKQAEGRFGLLLGQHTMASGGHGVSLEHTNLGFLRTLKQRYGVPVGFVDHTPYEWMSAVAVAAGAEIVTKHLALKRSERGPDWQVCLEPDEMQNAISLARKAGTSISSKSKVLAPGEHLDQSIMRRSIVALRDLPIGTVLTRSDLAFKRPGTGLELNCVESLISRRLRRAIGCDQQIKLEDLE